MKDSPLPYRQIEWWLITVLVFLIIFTNLLGGKINLENLNQSSDPDQALKYFAFLVIPLTLYVSFYFLHIKIIPNYQKDGKKVKMVFYSLMVFFGSWFLIGIFYVNGGFGQDLFIPFYFAAIFLYGGYLLTIKFINQLFLISASKNFGLYNIVRGVILYFFVLVFLFKFLDYYNEILLIIYAVIIPLILVLLFYYYYLIYRMHNIGHTKASGFYRYLLPALIFLIISIISIAAKQGEVLIAGALASVFILAVFYPLAQALFTKYHGVIERIDSLSNKLDQSSANLQFLRSQINPHFLFNALNTLYGTALQENAEKTAEGIQKLGDLMRFMLHENNQDKIPVEREKEYLVNYVDLQSLRTKGQEQIEILFNRSEEVCRGEIAPMLLIPFVENAFKHGISAQKKSWVKISLRCREGEVHLDINNSIHRSTGEDPEKISSGIGLQNVRQRLNLLYPHKHELIIRENEMEYFVHLSIQLKK